MKDEITQDVVDGVADVSTAKKRSRPALTSVIDLKLDAKLRVRLSRMAKAEGLELGHYLQNILEGHVLDSAEEGDALAARLAAKRAVIDHVVTLAQLLDKDGLFDADFVLTVMKTAAEDADFMEKYHAAVGGVGKKGARLQKPLNLQLARLIRKAVNAKAKRDDEGRAMRAQVAHEVMSSYPLLERDAG